ncbi:hypothetical protein MTR67_026764 [Solanum verrucosum]|uniref:Uncharacterized protein n=1 Tax=Solanum verrucosum TaxID=315347 RepID=A0AAF0R8D7_SOLVR|nr:hypothetical protein MTR67_026764 [Solanum verrucosum]
MAKMITQLDLISKHVMGGGFNMVNAIGTSSEQCSEDAKFEALYNEKVNYMGNQLGGSYPNYPRSGANQGWNKDMDNGWRYWRDRGGNWRDREPEKDRYIPPHDLSPIQKKLYRKK